MEFRAIFATFADSMEIRDIAKLYAMLPQVGALRHVLGNKSKGDVFLQGLVGSAAPMAFAALMGKGKGLFVFIMQDADEAGYFYSDLKRSLPPALPSREGRSPTPTLPRREGEGDERVLFFPSSYRRAVKFGQRDAANEILRTEVLARLTALGDVPEGKQGGMCIVTYPEALAELVPSPKTIDDRLIRLSTGQTADIVELERRLRELGFREEDYVYEPGQFAVRGSIVDVYSFSCELPYRIDFFGDEIDTIRTFEVEDQLSKEHRESVEIVPELAAVQAEKVPFLEMLPADSVLVTKDVAFVAETVARIYEEGFSSQAATERLAAAPEMERQQVMDELRRELQLVGPSQFGELLSQFRHVIMSGSPSPGREGKKSAAIAFHTVGQPLFHKNVDLLKRSVDDYQLQGYRLYVLADSPKQQERLREMVGPSFVSVDHTLHEGFVDHDLKACFFTDHQIFDRFHKFTLKSEKARSGKMALTMKELQELEIGDYLVHVDYGIGKFGGLVRIPQGDAYQEVIRIIYQHNDKVDVSIHSLYKISKYRRSDTGEPPRLSILGSGAWDRLKERTKKRIKDIARDLIRLYARRQKEKGFAYSPDTYLQNELEASFLYEDTPDQLRATQEVKADMEASKPMDRLVCGDVGFGKTEVAIRAAFKAACDSKQVALMVPTTVLAYQHFRTFSSRLKDMPVRVDYLTRAKSAKQTTELLKDLSDGKIDIIIGTHKLIGKSVKFKDLGLLIIDEEQKFGVSTKEKLRQMKSNVDTLTMSATPIPRTLQFSLVGARDLSVIQTPPPNRYPIQTEIHTFGAEIITDAINFEMSRNGQIYFVNNRISDLTHIAEMIHKHVPDARVAIGHGQMKPDELEQIILDFSNYDYDVLLSTTIVENGIDIPNANTIIINGAHNFGLSDLHQMRGRVGRGNRKAFCYLLAPPLAALNPESRRRLEALENFSDLGSGINIAMQDLDIRGAGNLLGAEQSGFISDLGYETYQKILNQAMAELRNETPVSRGNEGAGARDRENTPAVDNSRTPVPPIGPFVDDCTLESDLEMYFPDLYVPSDSERMLLYRELDNLAGSNDLDGALAAYRQRLTDRFGAIPQVAEELILVVPLRVCGKQLGIEKILLRQSKMHLYFVTNADSPYFQSEPFERILDYVSHHPKQCNFHEAGGKRSIVISSVSSVGEALTICRNILSD